MVGSRSSSSKVSDVCSCGQGIPTDEKTVARAMAMNRNRVIPKKGGRFPKSGAGNSSDSQSLEEHFDSGDSRRAFDEEDDSEEDDDESGRKVKIRNRKATNKIVNGYEPGHSRPWMAFLTVRLLLYCMNILSMQ